MLRTREDVALALTIPGMHGVCPDPAKVADMLITRANELVARANEPRWAAVRVVWLHSAVEAINEAEVWASFVA
jgi:hypothetical protein